MEGFIICPLCKFWKEKLIETKCCSAKYCQNCILELQTKQVGNCPRCKKQFCWNDTDYIPLNNLLKSVMVKCRFEGCKVMTTDLMKKNSRRQMLICS